MDEPVEKGPRRDDDGLAGVEEARAVHDAGDTPTLDDEPVDEGLAQVEILLLSTTAFMASR